MQIGDVELIGLRIQTKTSSSTQSTQNHQFACIEGFRKIIPLQILLYHILLLQSTDTAWKLERAKKIASLKTGRPFVDVV